MLCWMHIDWAWGIISEKREQFKKHRSIYSKIVLGFNPATTQPKRQTLLNIGKLSSVHHVTLRNRIYHFFTSYSNTFWRLKSLFIKMDRKKIVFPQDLINLCRISRLSTYVLSGNFFQFFFSVPWTLVETKINFFSKVNNSEILKISKLPKKVISETNFWINQYQWISASHFFFFWFNCIDINSNTKTDEVSGCKSFLWSENFTLKPPSPTRKK